jgi:chromosome segregation ATPase
MLVGILFLAACATPRTSNTEALFAAAGAPITTPQSTNSAGIFALGGAAGCAIAAALVGGSKTAVGTSAAVCGAAGAVVGGLSDQGRNQYNAQTVEYQRRFNAAEDDIYNADQQVRAAERAIATTRRELEQLNQQTRSDQTYVAQAEALRNRLNQQRLALKDQRLNLETRKQLVENELAAVQDLLNSTPNDQQLLQAKATLETQKAKLLASIQRLNGVEQSLQEEVASTDQSINRRR